MGPRLFSRGNDKKSLHEPLVSGFNGAAALQPRQHVLAQRRQREAVASMGPRLFSRGNTAFDRVEHAVHVASMGPRLFSRGNQVLPLAS